MVKLRSLEDFQTLPTNNWGIKEPRHDEERENALELDLIIVPGLAFDKQGWRIGHGKGYYDNFIQECNKLVEKTGKPKPLTGAFLFGKILTFASGLGIECANC
jgi:5-formyltetrahydrofolate cyclo-ligase